MAINTERQDYSEYVDKWELIDDIVSGDNLDTYLVTLNPDNTTTDNVLRNHQYFQRSVFYDIAGYTLKSLASLPFNKQPVIEINEQLSYLKNNTDGSGVDLNQQAKNALTEVIKKGRAGLFVTFPNVGKELTIQDMSNYYATINLIDAKQIINWSKITVGSVTKLNLVVISETISELNTETYKHETIEQITELYLNDEMNYSSRKWRKTKDQNWYIYQNEITPTDASGNPFKEIPFIFVGSEYNSTDINEPPLYHLCQQNIAHYRNSADFEDSVFYAGQSQPYTTGIDDTHLQLLQNNAAYVGSRNIIGVPSGESFGYATPEPNPLVRQAMLDKIDIMIGLGARFIKDNGTIKTATEAAGELKTAHSQLASIVENLNDAYTQAIKLVARFMGASDENISYQIDQEFIPKATSAQEMQAIIAGFMQGAIPASDYYRYMKRADLIDEDKTFEEFNDELNPFSGDMNESE